MDRKAKSVGVMGLALCGGLVLAIGAAGAARADEIVNWSNRFYDKIESTSAINGTTIIGNTPFGAGDPDSLVFDSSGNIIYGMVSGSAGFSTQLYRMDPTTGVSTAITSGNFSNNLRDLALDPGGQTILVSDDQNNEVIRVNLVDLPSGPVGTRTVLARFSGAPAGIAYDPSGDLFVAVNNEIVQISLTTGATIRHSAAYGFVDGLTYDPFSNMLYGAEATCIRPFALATLASSTCLGSFSDLDGIEADGIGNIIAADTGFYSSFLGSFVNADIYQYNLVNNTQSYFLINAAGIDDVAPIVGLGSPPAAVPEPGTLALFGTAVLGLMARYRKRN